MSPKAPPRPGRRKDRHRSVEIRKRNFIAKSALPYQSATGLVYDSGDFAAAADACTLLADWDGYDDRKAATAKTCKLRGRAIVSYIEDTGVFNDRMELRFDPSGALTIVAGTFSHGQSHATTYSQCVSDWLGIPMDRIQFQQGDTDRVSFGRGTYASGSAIIGGNALRAAVHEIIEKAKVVAAFLLESDAGDLEFRSGKFSVVGTDRTLELGDIARWTYHPARLPKQLRVGLEASAYFAAEPPGFPNGCHICEVEIDPDTGAVVVDRYTAVDDFGRLINPLIVAGRSMAPWRRAWVRRSEKMWSTIPRVNSSPRASWITRYRAPVTCPNSPWRSVRSLA